MDRKANRSGDIFSLFSFT